MTGHGSIRAACIALALGLVGTLLVESPVRASSQPETFVTMLSEPGDYIGGGQQRFYHPGNAEITMSGNAGYLNVKVSGGNLGDYFTLTFAAPPGDELQVGAYERAQRAPFREAGRPGISISGSGRGCNKISGSFEVKEIRANADGSIASFWAIYEQHCEGGDPALIGGVRYKSAPSGGVAMVGPRELQWSDEDREGQALVAPVTAVNPSAGAMSFGTPSIGGEDADLFDIRIDNCGGQTVAPDGSCRVWIRYRPERSGTNDAVLRLPESQGHIHTVPLEGFVHGGVTRFIIEGEQGDFVSGGKRWSYGPGNATFSVRGDYQRIAMDLTSDDGIRWSADFDAPNGDILAPNTRYEGATRYPFNGSGAGMSITGNSRGCNKLTGWFEVNDIFVDDNGMLRRAGISFMQRCDGGAPLYGVLDYRMPQGTTWPDPADGRTDDPTPSPSPSSEPSSTPSAAPTTSPTPAPSPSQSPEPTLESHKTTRAYEGGITAFKNKVAWRKAPSSSRLKHRVLLKKGDGKARRIGPRKGATLPGSIHRNKLVYQHIKSYRREKSKIKLYDIKRGRHRKLPDRVNTRHWEWAPSVWGRYLAFTRTVSEPARTRNWMYLMNIRTGNKRLIDWDTGDDGQPYVGQLNGRYIVWTKCGRRCKVYRQDHRTQEKIRLPKPRDSYDYAPSVTRDGTVFFARSSYGCGNDVAIYRWSPADGVSKVFDGFEELDLWSTFVVPRRDGGYRLYMDTEDCSDGNQDIHYIDIP